MITNKEVEQWISTILVPGFSGIEAKHVYSMAEISYKKGAEDATSIAKAECEACVAAENEACAKLADAREKKCHELADKPGYDQDEIDDILSKAFSFSTIANDIRKRQKDKSC